MEDGGKTLSLRRNEVKPLTPERKLNGNAVLKEVVFRLYLQGTMRSRRGLSAYKPPLVHLMCRSLDKRLNALQLIEYYLLCNFYYHLYALADNFYQKLK